MALMFSTGYVTGNDKNSELLAKLDCADVDEHYEISRCVRWIKENKFVKVALQFPDHLLHIAGTIALKLQEGVSCVSIYVLADTSYGSCCVDEVAAEHGASDSIIHFGPACLTPCSRLPVLYIFGKQSIDAQHVAQELLKIVPNSLVDCVLIVDVTLSHASSSLHECICRYYPNLVSSELIVLAHDHSSMQADASVFSISGRRMRLKNGLSIEDYFVFYIGHEGPMLTKLVMTLNKCQFFSYDPRIREARKEGIGVNKWLQKRYYAVEKARDSRMVGILMGTLGVSRYLEAVKRLKEVARLAGKKTYTLAVGRLNPAKLANFPEIDVFVLVACADNSLLDFKEYYQPVITPFEFELACVENRQWTGDYVADFRELMPGGRHYIQLSESDHVNEPRTNVSLITGHVNTPSKRTSKNAPVNIDRTIAKREELLMVSEIHSQAGGEYLMNRSWQGLDASMLKTKVAVVQEGGYGTASSYNHETHLMDNKK